MRSHEGIPLHIEGIGFQIQQTTLIRKSLHRRAHDPRELVLVHVDYHGVRHAS